MIQLITSTTDTLWLFNITRVNISLIQVILFIVLSETINNIVVTFLMVWNSPCCWFKTHIHLILLLINILIICWLAILTMFNNLIVILILPLINILIKFRLNIISILIIINVKSIYLVRLPIRTIILILIIHFVVLNN